MIVPQYGEFKANNASSRHALLTILLVYQMRQWVKPKPAYPDDIQEMFDLAAQIANGTKHFVPLAKTRTQPGFSSDFSDDFARPLIIELPSGGELSADQLLDKLVEFWKEQDRQHGPLSES